MTTENVKRYLFASIIAFFILKSFNTMSIPSTGIIIAVIAAAIGGILASFLFKNVKHKDILAGIVILVAFIGTKNYVMPYYYAETLDSHLKQTYPLYRTLAAYYPKEYNEVIERLKKIIMKHGFEENAVVYPVGFVDYAIEKSLPFAPVKDIYNYLKTRYEVEKKLYSSNPLQVLAIEAPGRLPSQHPFFPILLSIPKADIAKLMQAETSLIESSFKHRTPIQFSEDEAAKAREEGNQIMTSLTEKYEKEVVIDTFFVNTTPFKDPAKSAQVMLSLYELILSKGEEGGFLFKALYNKPQ